MKLLRPRVAILISCATMILGGCSAGDQATKSVDSEQSQADKAAIVCYTQGNFQWKELNPNQQALYSDIYVHKLAARAQATWEKALKEAGVAQTDGVLQLRQPDSEAASPQKLDRVTATATSNRQSELLQQSAHRIKLVWYKQMPISQLRPDEVVWYRAIYKKTLPPAQQKGWEKFLAIPPQAQARGGQMIELKQMY